MKEIRIRVIKQVQKGDGEAFRKLVQHYHELVYQVSYLIVGEEKKAEELASDVFLYVYSHIDNYFSTSQRFSLWLIQNTVSLGESRLNDAHVNKCASRMKPNSCSSALCLNEDIQAILMNICFKKRLALIFHSNYLFTAQEIGEVLHVPKTEISSYIWQGREMLREGLFST